MKGELIQVWSYLKPTHIPVSQATEPWVALLCENQFCSHTLLRCCWAMQLLGILASLLTWQYWELHSGVSQAVTQLMPGWGNARLQSKKPLWRPASGEPFSAQTAPPSWFHRWTKPLVGTATWVLQVWNSVCQDPSACCWEPLPYFSITIRFPAVKPTDFLTVFLWDESEWGLLRSNRIWGKLCLPQALSSPGGSASSCGCRTSLDSRWAALLALLMQSVLAFWGAGVLKPPTCSRIFLRGVLSHG